MRCALILTVILFLAATSHPAQRSRPAFSPGPTFAQTSANNAFPAPHDPGPTFLDDDNDKPDRAVETITLGVSPQAVPHDSGEYCPLVPRLPRLYASLEEGRPPLPTGHGRWAAWAVNLRHGFPDA